MPYMGSGALMRHDSCVDFGAKNDCLFVFLLNFLPYVLPSYVFLCLCFLFLLIHFLTCLLLLYPFYPE